MSVTQLPIELFEHAIDSLGDKRSLKATSLVCKAWLPRSRVNLFRTVELGIPLHLDHFMQLLSHAPHIAEYVEEIDISENSLLAVLRPTMSIVSRLPLLLTAYPLVRPLRMAVHNQLWLPTRYNPDYLHTLSQLSSVRSLDLFDVTFATIADFSLVLRALPYLKTLSAKHLDCQRQLDADTAANIGSTVPSLTTLRIVSTYPTSAIDWLVQYNSFPSLRDVECSYELSTNDSTQGLGAFWDNIGATLETLSISISKRSAGIRFPLGVIERQLDLSSSEVLRALRFDCRHERGVAPDWTWLSWLLSRLTCRTLSSIALVFQSSTHALASVHGFAEELDRILAYSSFSDGLNVVAFEFDFRDPFDPDEKQLLELFPALLLRGILRVT
ncbi:hypothetical protein C8Q79DRAFT_648081 [Trametes meyenii]|nr:hypothetical protein C8Q79DRAFT_648081 [Trametes meyenii]